MADYVCPKCLAGAKHRWEKSLLPEVKLSVWEDGPGLCEHCLELSETIHRVGLDELEAETREIFKPEVAEYIENQYQFISDSNRDTNQHAIVYFPDEPQNSIAFGKKTDYALLKETLQRKRKAREGATREVQLVLTPNLMHVGRYRFRLVWSRALAQVSENDLDSSLLLYPDVSDAQIVLVEYIDADRGEVTVFGWTTPKDIALGKAEVLRNLQPIEELEKFKVLVRRDSPSGQ